MCISKLHLKILVIMEGSICECCTRNTKPALVFVGFVLAANQVGWAITTLRICGPLCSIDHVYTLSVCEAQQQKGISQANSILDTNDDLFCIIKLVWDTTLKYTLKKNLSICSHGIQSVIQK